MKHGEGEEEEAWHGIAEAHPSQAKREVKACLDTSTGHVFLSNLSERTTEGKRAKKEARGGGQLDRLSPAAAAVVAIITTASDALPHYHDLSHCSCRPLSPLTRKALELAQHVDLSAVGDYRELERRTRMAALWVFMADPPSQTSKKRRRGQAGPAVVRMTYSVQPDLAITYSSIEDQNKTYRFDSFLQCTGQPMILRGDPRLLLREDTGSPYFEDLAALLRSRAALIFASPQSRREEYGGVFAAVDSQGISLPRMASLNHSTQWAAYEVCRFG